MKGWSSFLSVVLCAALGMALGSSVARAQNSPVYVVDQDSGKIFKVDFDNLANPTARVNTYGDANQREELEGILVRDDVDGIHLVVTDSADGKVLFYNGIADGNQVGLVITSAIAHPEGPSAGRNGELFLVSKSGPPQVWKIPPGAGTGGYGTPVLIDPNVPGSEIEDTRVVSVTMGGLVAGDLLVLSEHPARVWRYLKACVDSPPCSAAQRIEYIPTSRFPYGSEPNGLAIAPDGSLLVATEQEQILGFPLNGGPSTVFFAGSPLQGKLKIAVGLQGGENRAFVTAEGEEGYGAALRFRIESNGSGTLLTTVTSTLDEPVGVGVASNAAATPAGSNFSIAPVGSHELFLEQVTTTGFTSIKASLCEDPSPGANKDLAQCVSGAPSRTLPGYLRAFPLEETPTFLIDEVNTTAGFTKTQQHHIDEARYGFETQCLPLAFQPRTYFCTDADDDPVVEGTTCFDISTACASNIARGDEASFFVTGYDSRSLKAIMQFKLGMLVAALDGRPPASGGLSVFIKSPTLKKLRDEAANALKQVNKGNFTAAQPKIEHFLRTVQDNPGHFNNSTRNVFGELVARGESAAFINCQAAGGTPATCNRCLGTCP